MAETTASKKTITLKTFDSVEFTVEEPAAKLCQTINRMIEDGVPVFGTTIPISNVTGKTLSKVIEYCNKHADSFSSSSTAAASSSSTTAAGKAVAYSSDDGKYAADLLMDWDAEFVNVDEDALFDLILAANYLNIKSLIDLTCKTVADKMIGRSPEEIRGNFHIQNDYTLEDEDEVRRENQWAFD